MFAIPLVCWLALWLVPKIKIVKYMEYEYEHLRRARFALAHGDATATASRAHIALQSYRAEAQPKSLAIAYTTVLVISHLGPHGNIYIYIYA